MLETQTSEPNENFLDPLRQERIDRSKGRTYRDGYSEQGIDRIDLHHVESTACADGAFAAALERAIEAGLERDIAVNIEEHGTERPMAVAVPSVPLGEQIPSKPQRALNLARRLAYHERREAIVDRKARELEARMAMQRAPIAVGAFTLFDLSDAACHFSAGDSPFLFCGAPVQFRSPYCACHHARCHGAFWGNESPTNRE